ncbi:MAG: 50S ribosomal protein L29 [Marinifilaceae bacterium]
MKNQEIIELTTDELKERIATERTALTKLKMNHVVTPLENPSVITKTRKNISRMMTELRKRELTVK